MQRLATLRSLLLRWRRGMEGGPRSLLSPSLSSLLVCARYIAEGAIYSAAVRATFLCRPLCFAESAEDVITLFIVYEAARPLLKRLYQQTQIVYSRMLSELAPVEHE